MKPLYTASIRLVLLAFFALEVWLAAAIPVRSSEAYLYDQFVRPSLMKGLTSPTLNSDVLYALLEKRSIGLFHVSEFSIRIPSLIFGAVYPWLLYRFLTRSPIHVALRLTIGVIALLAPLQWHLFDSALGAGTALTLTLFGIAWVYLPSPQPDKPPHFKWAGFFFGLAVAAELRFSIPILLIIGASLIKYNLRNVLDHLVIPALITSFVFLILPVTHATQVAHHGADLPYKKNDLVYLGRNSDTHPLRIAAPPEVAPIVSFYHSKFRTDWIIVDPASSYDYLARISAGRLILEAPPHP